MDPYRNAALRNAKLQAILSSYQQQTSISQPSAEDSEDMPAPPAYHMVVDPEVHTPAMSSSHDLEEEERAESSDDEEIPEITINASTQIRGTGNIVSIAQMDSARIASLVATILSGDPLPEATTPPTPPQNVTQPSTSRTERKRGRLNLNITVNCGATIIGDRNIVGPGLGDIARQMQLAQRNAALQAHQQQQQAQVQQQKLAQGLAQAQAQKQAQMNLQHSMDRSERVPSLAQHHATLYQSQANLGLGSQVVTPPMSRSGSLGSTGSGGSPTSKRKAEDDAGEGLLLLKRRC
ncbi:hypothetical protein N0V94_006414 [Neodidymelliopsis sp. IMI 364377]|nr:hypothetical protein N0V94_006414 [Neodidymelliopsis sp. IMI 364377]